MLKKIIELLETAARQTRAFVLALLVFFRVLSRSTIALRRYPRLSAAFLFLVVLYAAHYAWTVMMQEDLVRNYYHRLNAFDYVGAYQCWEGHDGWTASSWSDDYAAFINDFAPTQRTDVDSVSIEKS
jgi:hypothetical protein